MATTNLSIKYRPVRIGFLVREGSIGDLVKASGINVLLWGGIYNPVIPVSGDKKLAERLINLFSVDVLYAVSHTKEIDKLLVEHPFLEDPRHYAENIFYEDWHTKKNIIGYLDSINIVNYYWEREFKHKLETFKSNCVLVKWEDDDVLKNLFAICFGYFPVSYNLKDNFENAFVKGLRAQKLQIGKDKPIDVTTANNLYPLLLTGSKLTGYGESKRDNGIYIGDENNFDDLVYFWNLRASGLVLEFLPKDHLQRFEKFVKAYLGRLDKIPNQHPNIEDWIGVHYQTYSDEEIKRVIKRFRTKKHFVFCHHNEVTWSGLNVKPADFYFEWSNVLASVDETHDRYIVSLSLPEKPVIKDPVRDINSQNLVVSINPVTEFEYPNYTLKPPFIRELNEFYSREIVSDPWELRVEKDGIGIIIKIDDESLSLFPLAYQTLVQKIFECAKIKTGISQAGLLTKRIIEKLGGIDGGRVFKIKGVRQLIRDLKADECIGKGEATNAIWSNGQFQKYEKLYIDTREKSKLQTDDVFDFLLKKDFFRAGLELVCNHCRLKSWLPLREIDDWWVCSYCGNKNQTSLHLTNRGDWKFRKSGLFAKDNSQEGAIPVILTLLQFLRRFHFSNLIYTSSLKLTFDSKNCEIDFCILQYERGDNIEIGIAECKSEGGKINQNDIDNFKLIREKFKAINIDCFLIFSKTVDGFDSTEINLFKKLADDNIPCILFTNKELEPYRPSEEYKGQKLPYKHAFTLKEMASNSKYVLSLV